jgi:tRNASer (uridine44-2'-O)-methyltransferase
MVASSLPVFDTLTLGMLGRKRVGSLETASHNVEQLIEGVRQRGQFKTRRPEGKAGDH